MKRNFFLILLSFVSLISRVVNAQTPEFATVQDGIEYAKVVRPSQSAEGKPENVVINLLRLDLIKVRLDVVHALDETLGVETTSSIAARHGAIAAINAGFFKLDGIYKGDPAGVLMIDKNLLSESNNGRIALAIGNLKGATSVNFQHLDLSLKIMRGKEELAVSGINRLRGDDELVIFTPEFHRSTLTNSNGLEITVKDRKIGQILDGKGSTEIPADGYILSASGKMRVPLLKFARRNAKIMIVRDVHTTESKGESSVIAAEDIVGGVPQLIKNGKIEITWEQEKIGKSFVETHHPRTAVAKLKDGKFLMLTIDGRSEESGGMSLNQLAAFLLEIGATDAMNLDGGGSTTMFLNGKVMNKPSDKEGERSVSDAILVFPRQKP